MTDTPILNPDAIQALRALSAEGDSEFLRELIGIYLIDTPKQVAQLEAALARQDSALAMRAAHAIKGSSGNFGALEFSGLAAEMEAHCKANNLAAAHAALPGFKAGFARVVTALEQLAAGT